MARLLNATGYFSSILAAVCLVLALVAAPIGEARADEPVLNAPAECFTPGFVQCTTNNSPELCTRVTCAGDDRCKCIWGFQPGRPEGCYCVQVGI